MKQKHLAAVDLGASSGRVISGLFDGRKLQLQQTHRFANQIVTCLDVPYWDVLYLYGQILLGLQAASAVSAVDSIGIDTWGCDFGILDQNGDLIGNVIAYRDARNDAAMERFHSRISAESMYARTGVANMALNTVYQLYKLRLNGAFPSGRTVMMLPDLLSYFLCGEKSSELAALSTTQMLRGKDFDADILRELGLTDPFPRIINAGTKRAAASVPGLQHAEVVSVPGHDTACASLCIDSTDSIFLSSGTWSLIGAKSRTSIANPLLCEQGYSSYNDGFDGYVTVRDIMGLFLLNSCKKVWNLSQPQLGFGDIVEQARQAPAFASFIDPDDTAYFDGADLIGKIHKNARGKISPTSVGEISRCIFESLALKYRYAIDQLEHAVNKHYPTITIVGGGSQNQLLCQFVANATGRPCLCGMPEATSVGNLLSQLLAAGEISSLSEGRDLLCSSAQMQTYLPEDTARWNEAYAWYTEHVL